MCRNSNITKLNLRKEPHIDRIEGFTITNANYTRAVKLLRERYRQHYKIIFATMQAVLKLQAPSSFVASLRAFMTEWKRISGD